MARVMREVAVCDVCGSEQDVAAVSVAVDGAQQNPELCAVHRTQLRQALAGVLGASDATTGRPATRRGRKAAAGGAPAGKRATRKTATRKDTATARTRMPRTTCPHCGLEMGVQNLSRHIAAKHPEAG
jgi:transcription elongation factor Elf1